MGNRDVNFHFLYDGPGMVTPQANAYDFKPALQALTLLLEEAFVLLRPSRPRVNIEITPGQGPGGFSVRLIEIAPPPGLLARWLGRPTDYGTASMTAVLTSLGLISSRGLIHLVRWLRGREPVSITPQPDGSAVFELLEDGWPARQTILPGTAKLYPSERVRSLLLAVLEPLTFEGIHSWVIGRGGGMQTWLVREELYAIRGLPLPDVEQRFDTSRPEDEGLPPRTLAGPIPRAEAFDTATGVSPDRATEPATETAENPAAAKDAAADPAREADCRE